MTPHVAGVDGTPGGWAVVMMHAGRSAIRKVAALSSILDGTADFDIIAVDVPIGLLDAYEVGGRACDRAARKFLGKTRRNSVFPAPVRPVLAAISAFAIVAVLLRAFPPALDASGQLELKAFGLEFSGPSGPITLWLMCFLGFVFALRMLRT